MKIESVVVFRVSDSQSILNLTTNIINRLKDRKIQVIEIMDHFSNISDIATPTGDIDLVIVVGGDGTALRASRVFAERNIPILPVNKGSFGFINEVQQEEWEDSLNELLQDSANIGEYHLLEVESGDRSWLAFNDITFASAGYGAMSASVYRDNKVVTRYRADGVIISTPTGSTAHSLSAGGPIIAPGLNVFMINPIAPFSLSNRPIILSVDKELLVVLDESRSKSVLVVDGQVVLGLLGNCRVQVKDSALKARIVHSSKRDYFEILRNKLGWGGEFRA